MSVREVALSRSRRDVWLGKLDELPETAHGVVQSVRDDLSDVVVTLYRCVAPAKIRYDDDGHLWIGLAK